MKKTFSFIALLFILIPLFCTPGTATPEVFTFDITDYDAKTIGGGVVIYRAGDTAKTVSASDHELGSAMLLTFDQSGRLYEAGSSILPTTSDYYGAQTSFTVPAGGFTVAFDSRSPGGLGTLYNKVMDGIMIYNATVSVTYDMTAKLDEAAGKLSLTCGDPATDKEETKRYLFVGNSTTYFNGNPIKFEALCRAAGLDVKAEYCTFGSAYLSEFASETHERGKAFRQKLAERKYDYIVFQDAAKASYAQSDEALSVLIPLARENGATPLLYMRYSTTVQGAAKFYNTYTRLAEKYEAATCKTAVAFAYCMEDHPEIILIAEDGGHHSKEGSYLAACTWLYSFGGIDPRGNTYTAGLDAETVSALQNEAYRAVAEEYNGEIASVSQKVIDGIAYENAALGKAYTPTGEAYDGAWTDTDADGKPLGKLTDGISAAAGDDTEVGCYTGKAQSITIDLGAVYDIKLIETRIFGNPGWGIPDPADAEIDILISTDGKDFVRLAKAEKGSEKTEGEWRSRLFTLEAQNGERARYIRLFYSLGGNFLWTDEIAVYGKQAAPAQEDTHESDTQSTGSVTGNEKSGKDGFPAAAAALIISAAAIVVCALIFIAAKRKKTKRQ